MRVGFFFLVMTDDETNLLSHHQLQYRSTSLESSISWKRRLKTSQSCQRLRSQEIVDKARHKVKEYAVFGVTHITGHGAARCETVKGFALSTQPPARNLWWLALAELAECVLLATVTETARRERTVWWWIFSDFTRTSLAWVSLPGAAAGQLAVEVARLPKKRRVAS